jgi:hypothetical protein
MRVGYKKAPDRPRELRYAARSEVEETSLGGTKPELLSNIQAQFRPILAAWRGRVGGLNQARVIEYLIGDDMRLFLLRALPAMWTQLG